jgi:hypothetical protein
MTEAAALDIIAVRAIESADRERSVWSDADRAWASRAAAEVVGESASAELFFTRRAQLALERLGDRFRILPRVLGALRWRSWIAYAVVTTAFVVGVAVDRVGDSQRINVLAPPVLVLLVCNLAVYAAIAMGYVIRYGDASAPGPLRRTVVRLATRAPTINARVGEPFSSALATLATDWARVAAPLYNARAARILHFAAAAFALGVIVGLYVRGVALEYRATWESTFLDPATVRALLAVALAPGAWVSGMAIPDVAQVSAIRAPGSENAARWLHLMALTLLVLVVLPRLLLGFVAWLLERHRAARLQAPLDEPYFQRLVRVFRGGPTRVQVLPYAYTPVPSSVAALEAILTRFMGGSAKVITSPPFAYGDEDARSVDALTAAGGTVVLFNLATTPEREVHGAFVAAIAASGVPPIVVIDESAFRARVGVDASSLDARRALWRDTLDPLGLAPAFVDLAAPDLVAAEAALDAASPAGRQ